MDVYIQCMGMSGQKRSVSGRVHTVYGMSGQKRSVSGRVHTVYGMSGQKRSVSGRVHTVYGMSGVANISCICITDYLYLRVYTRYFNSQFHGCDILLLT